MDYKVSVTVSVEPEDANDIALLAWLLVENDPEEFEFHANIIVNAFMYWRDRALDLFPDDEVVRLFEGFSPEILEKRRSFDN